MNLIARLIIVIALTVILAEIAPEAVNAILLLILIGLVLSNWKAFSQLNSLIGTLGDDKK